jgi:hypothetical protein
VGVQERRTHDRRAKASVAAETVDADAEDRMRAAVAE